VCQICKDFISEAGAAVLLWNNTEDEVVAVHKACQRTRAMQKRYPLSMELDTALAYILWNTGMDDKALKRARDVARDLSEL